MRQAVLWMLAFATPAMAEPALEIRPPQTLASYSGSLVAPSGQTVWTCEVAIAKGSPALPECPKPVDWFQGDGRYVLVGWAKSRSSDEHAGFPVRIEFDASQQDDVIRVNSLTTESGVERVRVAPAGVQLTVSSAAPFTVTLTNESTQDLHPYRYSGSFFVQYERKVNDQWLRLHQQWAFDGFKDSVLRPGEVTSTTLIRRITDALEPGEYRLVALTHVLAPGADPKKTDAPKIIHEVRSNSFTLTEPPRVKPPQRADTP